MHRTVLVTGAAGFLGSHVVRALLASDVRPRALVRPGRIPDHLERLQVEFAVGDVLDERSLIAACRGAQGLIHCAARTGFWSRQNDAQRKVNVEGVAALYRAAHRMGVERIVHVSSVAAVGATRDGRVLDEDAVWNLRSLGVNYATTKHAGEQRALAAARGGMPLVVVNPGAILGPRLDGRSSSSLLARVAAGRQRSTPAGGASVTDVEDVARAILRALDVGRIGERYILAGHNLTWDALFEAAARLAQVPAPRRRLGPRLTGTVAQGLALLDVLRLTRPPWTPEVWRSYGWYAWYDSDKARRELGYAVRPLDEILRRTLDLPSPEGGS